MLQFETHLLDWTFRVFWCLVKEEVKFTLGTNGYEYENDLMRKFENDKKKYQEELQRKLTNTNILTQNWYFIKFQIFCKTDKDSNGNIDYVLAEVNMFFVPRSNQSVPYIRPTKIWNIYLGRFKRLQFKFFEWIVKSTKTNVLGNIKFLASSKILSSVMNAISWTAVLFFCLFRNSFKKIQLERI